jgi:hypothetical protein
VRYKFAAQTEFWGWPERRTAPRGGAAGLHAEGAVPAPAVGRPMGPQIAGPRRSGIAILAADWAGRDLVAVIAPIEALGPHEVDLANLIPGEQYSVFVNGDRFMVRANAKGCASLTFGLAGRTELRVAWRS